MIQLNTRKKSIAGKQLMAGGAEKPRLFKYYFPYFL